MANTKFNVGEDVLVKAKIIGIGITEEGTKYTANIDPDNTFEFDEEELIPVEEE